MFQNDINQYVYKVSAVSIPPKYQHQLLSPKLKLNQTVRKQQTDKFSAKLNIVSILEK